MPVRLLLVTVLLTAAGCASAPQEEGRPPNTARDIGSALGGTSAFILGATPIVGQVLDSVDDGRANVNARLQDQRERRAADEVRSMQWAQCSANPCLYPTVCPALFPDFLLPACPGEGPAPGSSTDAGESPPPPAPAAALAPLPRQPSQIAEVETGYELPPRYARLLERRLAEQVERATEQLDPPPPLTRAQERRIVESQEDRGAEVCDPTLIGGAWRCQSGKYVWDPDLIYEWTGYDWVVSGEQH